jgi:hypothetical protein
MMLTPVAVSILETVDDACDKLSSSHYLRLCNIAKKVSLVERAVHEMGGTFEDLAETQQAIDSYEHWRNDTIPMGPSVVRFCMEHAISIVQCRRTRSGEGITRVCMSNNPATWVLPNSAILRDHNVPTDCESLNELPFSPLCVVVLKSAVDGRIVWYVRMKRRLTNESLLVPMPISAVSAYMFALNRNGLLHTSSLLTDYRPCPQAQLLPLCPSTERWIRG